MRAPIAIGQTFGGLTVRSLNRGRKNFHPTAECICSCGRTCVKRLSHLRSGDAKKCPRCSWQAAWSLRRPTDQITGLNRAYHGYLSGAVRRGYPFDLTKEQVNTLLISDCRYCGQVASRIQKGRGRNGGAAVNGIDRVDNGIGYTVENSVPCCSPCNRAKAEMSVQEFVSWVDRVHTHMKIRK